LTTAPRPRMLAGASVCLGGRPPPNCRPTSPLTGRSRLGRAGTVQRTLLMFQLNGSPSRPPCDGLTPRDFVRVGALGLSGFMLPDLLAARARAAAAGRSTRTTSVVWLWLGGGPTHVETFDPKMSAPVEFRSTVGAVQSKLPGVQLGGVFPKVAEIADQMAFVRSFAHRNSGHGGGPHWVRTGSASPPADNGMGQVKPGMGAILSRQRGASNPSTGLPTYVRLNGILGDGPAWLGASYAP